MPVRGGDRPGLATRECAVEIVDAVVLRKMSLDHAFSQPKTRFESLETRDRAAVRRIVMAVLRRFNDVDATVLTYLDKGYPKRSGKFQLILIVAAAQILLLDAPAHAAIDIAVTQIKNDQRARPFAGLANAVLRRLAESGAERLAQCDTIRNCIPGWLRESWAQTYGPVAGDEIALALLAEPGLDITTKSDADKWAEALSGIVVETGTVRRRNEGRIEELPGYTDGAWWVQDAASALPIRLFGDAKGRRIGDLCAAPGGKTAQLCNAGAIVTAIDISPKRVRRLKANMARLQFAPETVIADVTDWRPEQPFDGVLLDAPCSATGTIRRHPDILFGRAEDDVGRLAAVQRDMLEAASHYVGPGGLIVYATCSLQPEEGPDRIKDFLARRSDFERAPIDAVADSIPAEMVTGDGDLRTLPHHLPNADRDFAGLDGFFAARLRRRA